MRHPCYPNLEMMEPKYTPELGQIAIRLLQEGKSFSAVGRAVGVHRDTIKNWGLRYNPRLGNAVKEAKQRSGREKSKAEALAYLDKIAKSLPSNSAEQGSSSTADQLSTHRKLREADEEFFNQLLLKREQEIMEREQCPEGMQGFWVG